jgi:hypothetical protein
MLPDVIELIAVLDCRLDPQTVDSHSNPSV